MYRPFILVVFIFLCKMLAGSTGTMIDAHGSAVFKPLRCQFFTYQLVEGWVGWGRMILLVKLFIFSKKIC